MKALFARFEKGLGIRFTSQFSLSAGLETINHGHPHDRKDQNALANEYGGLEAVLP